jgi:hypothetical protein
MGAGFKPAIQGIKTAEFLWNDINNLTAYKTEFLRYRKEE